MNVFYNFLFLCSFFNIFNHLIFNTEFLTPFSIPLILSNINLIKRFNNNNNNNNNAYS